MLNTKKPLAPTRGDENPKATNLTNKNRQAIIVWSFLYDYSIKLKRMEVL